MKKLLFLVLSTVGIISMAQAKTIFVSPTGVNTNDGLSWATAVQTLGQANTLSAAGDVVYIKAGTYTRSSAHSIKVDVSWYGGFAGTETSHTERALSDLDGNGIVEPWEFSNPSIFSFTITASNGLTFGANASVQYFDGFKITGTSTQSITTAAGAFYKCIQTNNNLVFQNNTIAGWTLTGSSTVNDAYYDSPILKIAGNNAVVNNCLIEKNEVVLTAPAGQTDALLNNPFIGITAATATGRNIMSNCIVRNNKIKVNFSATSIAAITNIRGMIINVIPGAAGYYSTLKNTIVHNNDVQFIPGSVKVLVNSGVITAGHSTSNLGDSIVNCVIANNKCSNIYTAGIRVQVNGTTTGTGTQYQSPYHTILNNVMYNNIYDSIQSDGNPAVFTPQVRNYRGNTYVHSVGGLEISNNIMNGGSFVLFTANANLTDLASTNTGTNAPYFSNPTTFAGANRVAGSADSIAIAQSRWTIQTESYLKAKGKTLAGTALDKAGVLFANPRSVGAYEFTNNTAVVNPAEVSLFNVVGMTLQFKIPVIAEIYNTQGQLLVKKEANKTSITLVERGIYLVKTHVASGIQVKKIFAQ